MPNLMCLVRLSLPSPGIATGDANKNLLYGSWYLNRVQAVVRGRGARTLGHGIRQWLNIESCNVSR